jgi:hypothetical protein
MHASQKEQAWQRTVLPTASVHVRDCVAPHSSNDAPLLLLLFLLSWCQVERHRRAAEAARAALAANDQQLKELSKEAAKADKDRCAGSALVCAAGSLCG